MNKAPGKKSDHLQLRPAAHEPAAGKNPAPPAQQKLNASPGMIAQRKFVNQLVEEKARPNNTGMPDNLKSGIENLSGVSMDDVKVHYSSPLPAQMNALAYAQGTDIHVGAGQDRHLPHEAWHIVQQRQGRVQPTTTVNGTPVNDNPGLEHEADVMGAKALQRKTGKNSDPQLNK